MPRNSSLDALYDNEPLDFSNDPPLLEELEIDFELMWLKTKAVLQPFRKSSGPASLEVDKSMDSDLTGPIFFWICLGCSLLLQGKVHFGYIYGFGVFGCASLYVLLNLLSPPQNPPIDFWQVMSTLGYCLLPVVLVAVLGIVASLTGAFGQVASGVAIAWCTLTATRIFASSLKMEKQRFLIAYPVGLLYACFVLITIF